MSTGDRAGETVKERNARTPPPAPDPLAVVVPDSHTHMDMQSGDVAEIVAAARAVGVAPLIQIGVDLASSQWAAQTAADHQGGVWAAVALHPNEAPRLVHGDGVPGVEPDDTDWAGQARPAGGEAALAQALEEIDRLAARPEVRAVGETGLDYFRTGEAGRAAQQESFRRHIALAKHHDKALVVHDREAHDDVWALLDEEGAPGRVVLHCFSGDAAFAEACAERGYYMSFAGNVTFARAEELRATAQVVPASLLLVETDAPFLTPAPYRGRPNAPSLVPLTVRALAAQRGVEESELAGHLADNARRAFQLP